MANNALPILSGLSSLLGISSSIGSAYTQAKAYEMQGKYQAQVGAINSEFAELAAEEAKRRGELAISQERKNIRQVRGSQRASLAAQGIDIDSGSALEVQLETEDTGARNILTIKTSAVQEAWGFKTKALMSTAEGKFSSAVSDQFAQNTILTGGLQAAAYGIKGGYDYFKTK